jgi:hypothetical protein
MSKRASVNEPQTEDEGVMAFLDRFEREKQAKKVRFEEPSTDMIGKTVVIVDGRDRVATPLVVGFVIDEAMPLRLRQSIRVAGNHSFCVTTCSRFGWTADNRSVLSDDGAKTAEGLVQEADSEDADSEEQKQEDKDCEELNEFLTKQLTTDKPPLLLSKPNFVIYLQ